MNKMVIEVAKKLRKGLTELSICSQLHKQGYSNKEVSTIIHKAMKLK